jgi:cytochrome oxidase assembly protein ShyY1
MSVARALVPTLAAVALVAVAVSLGNWQTRRADEKLGLQQQREAADRDAPALLGPLPLSDADARQLEGRRVAVRGTLVPERNVYIDNRSHKGVAGFHLATPLRIEGARAASAEPMHVLILRGWVPRDPYERTRLPALPAPAGVIELTGLAQRDLPQALELQPSGMPGPGQRIWQNLTLEMFAAWSGLRLQPLLIRQTAPARGDGGPVADEMVREWPQPGLDVDKHRGYAFQWYALAGTTAALWAWFVVLRPLVARRGAAGRAQ